MKDFFLNLVRLGIGKSTEVSLPAEVDWPAVKVLAEQQGLIAIVLDGLDVVRQQGVALEMPEKRFMKQWVGEVLYFEGRYEQYMKSISEMARFYNGHGFKMMVLKGYACSLDWPRPNHRPCGDIDIWLFGRQKEADAALKKERGVKIDNSHHHHTIFSWRDFTVENHYDFIDVHHRKSGPKLEAILKRLGMDDSVHLELNGETVYLPTANLHALFMVYHNMLHFTSTEMNLRQLMDWGFFVEKHKEDVDWDWLTGMIEEFHLTEFYNIMNAICVEDLGFEAESFPAGQVESSLKARVLADVLSPEFGGDEPKNLFARVAFKYRRWRANEWKHKLCFKESMWSIFWTAVWSHILKPGSI